MNRLLSVITALLLIVSTEAHQTLQPGQTSRGRNVSQILDNFFIRGYDKRVRPNYGGLPVDVGVTMQIISISTVSEVQMDFTSDFYFRQRWRDERLSFGALPALESMTVGAEVAEKIWVPDTFFANEKSAYFHTATTPNTFLRISHNGDVLRSIRLTVTASCPMDLRYFPMDRQSCTIEIESFGYTMKDISYRWSDGEKSVRISKEVELPQFKVLGHSQRSRAVALSTGNYSRLVCEIRFVRSMGYYLIQIYIPAGLIVVISWVSFWLHRNATPARVALGVTTVLTMTTLMSSTNAALPKISYVKSIDVYLGTCFVMVFASLLEYATVGYLGKRIAMRRTRCQQMAKLAEQRRQLEQLGDPYRPGPYGGAGPPYGGVAGYGGLFSLGPSRMHTPGAITPHYDKSCVSSPTEPTQQPHDISPPIVKSVSTCQVCPTAAPREIREVSTAPTYMSLHERRRGVPADPCCAGAVLGGLIGVGGSGGGIGMGGSGGTTQSCGCPSQPTLPPPTSTTLAATTTTNTTITAQQVAPSTSIPMEVRLRMIDSKGSGLGLLHRTTSSLENALSQPPPTAGLSISLGNLSTAPGSVGHGTALLQEPMSDSLETAFFKNPNKLFGVSPSDIDKYSRVVFPVCFVCFNLMYWIIYLHISDVLPQDLVPDDASRR
ncbi:gamma-aminobutyric acid receptor subunit beta-like [Varroa jacobsoni]|nr:gamma-aminobutyric acid receptor subunit beta-like [Varroa jacobsoni]